MAVRVLQDPFKLAEHTKYLLEVGHRNKAAQLVRTASKKQECTVSWNHLINDLMRKGKVNMAFEFYNEVSYGAMRPS